MNKNIKRICIQLAMKAFLHETFSFDIHGTYVTAMVTPQHHSSEIDWEWEYYDHITLNEDGAEEKLIKALKYVESLGGTIDGR